MTLGGRRVGLERPRVHTADGESAMPLTSYEHFADRDQLEGVVLELVAVRVSTRKYRRVQEPVGSEVEDDARSISKSAVSRTFVQRTRDRLWRLMNRPLADLRLAVMMLDGIELHRPHEHCRAGDLARGREARALAVGRTRMTYEESSRQELARSCSPVHPRPDLWPNECGHG